MGDDASNDVDSRRYNSGPAPGTYSTFATDLPKPSVVDGRGRRPFQVQRSASVSIVAFFRFHRNCARGPDFVTGSAFNSDVVLTIADRGGRHDVAEQVLQRPTWTMIPQPVGSLVSTLPRAEISPVPIKPRRSSAIALTKTLSGLSRATNAPRVNRSQGLGQDKNSGRAGFDGSPGCDRAAENLSRLLRQFLHDLRRERRRIFGPMNLMSRRVRIARSQRNVG